MKKSQIVKLFPRRAEIRRELNANRRALAALAEKVTRQEGVLGALEGVALYDGHPVRVVRSSEAGFAVAGAGTDNGRSAVASYDEPENWSVTGYRNADDAGRDLGCYRLRTTAEKVAAAYVATGRLVVPRQPGRPRKAVA